MRKIAIIGAGQAGLLLGISLVEAGYAVTIFSDQTPYTILNGCPRAIPTLFADALQIERDLGLNFWDDDFQGSHQVHNNIYDADGNVAVVVSSCLEKPWQAVDQRLKFFYWIQEFVKRGGEFVTQTMMLSDLEECCKNYDLVVVAGGKSIISYLFERDNEKSTHHKPARKLAGGIFTGVKTQKGDYSTFKLNTFPNIGEIFQFPFYDKAKGASCAFVFEAYPDGAMAPFLRAKNGQEFVEQSKKLIKEQVYPSGSLKHKQLQITWQKKTLFLSWLSKPEKFGVRINQEQELLQ